jgi:hypothetical protein
MAKVTLVVPARNEIFLRQTLLDVLAKARGDIAVYAVLDGYDIPAEEVVSDPRLTYVRWSPVPHTRKRQAINMAVAQATGPYVMSLDAHCMVAEGFDVILAETYVENSVMIPRRQRLDAEHWCLQTQADDRPPIDYEYTQWPLKFDKPGLHGFRWDARTHAHADLMIDETMHFQGSCWFMTNELFERLDLMQIEGYTGWGQEAEEIGLKTWCAGGQVLSNKHTWYAHLHKGSKYGRMWQQNKTDVDACNTFSFDHWVRQQQTFFTHFVERFWPVPNWPRNWQERLYA